MIRRIISTVVTVSDPITLAVRNGDEQLLTRLRDNFDGKCAYNCMIVRVLRILSRDLARVNLSTRGGTASIPVTFIADTILYEVGDVCVDAKCMNVQMGSVGYCTFAHGFAAINDPANAAVVSVGNYIIGRVIAAQYETTKPSIVLGLETYTHAREQLVFACATPYVHTEQAEAIIERIRAVREEISAIDAAHTAFVATLFYPWKRPQSDPPGSTRVDVTSAPDTVPPYLCLDARVHDTAQPYTGVFSPIALGFARRVFPADYRIIEGISTEDVVVAMLGRHLKALTCLRDAAMIYGDAAVQRQHRALLTTITNTKLV